MSGETEKLFIEDPTLKEIRASVLDVNDRGGIIVDRTVFYATSGGQPGDTGTLTRADGSAIEIGATIYGAEKSEIIHVPTQPSGLPEPGEAVGLQLDWPRRHNHMRMHSALHLLCSLIPFPVTGGSIGEAESRLDFDIEDAGAIDKDRLTAELGALVAAAHPITSRWITDDELAANPEMVRTMSVKPPTGTGKVRLVAIGADEEIDLQPCGGTHVSDTSEIGPVHVAKIEKKGRQNRRVRIRFGEAP
jgi:misacylated tRNA(Ala) deacylase